MFDIFVKTFTKSTQMTSWNINELPILDTDFETKKILKALPSAHAALAELKATADSIPNQQILINTLSLQEAKDSSAIENIITTHDELFKADLDLEFTNSPQAKEVQHYITALKTGFECVQSSGMLTIKTVLQIQEKIENNRAGIRKLPGTLLKNSQTGEIVYSPPQEYDAIVNLLSNLERYINDSTIQDLDTLIKMAIIHFQFESIHPFYDGNGRTGRIINILYLILEKKQNLPILYLSNYIIKNKNEYYARLQAVRDHNNWEDWILFMITAIESNAKETIQRIIEIKSLMQLFKHQLRNNYKFYSQDLLNSLFKHPYTKIQFLVNDLGVSRLTASSYLKKLSDDGILVKRKIGTANYYVNVELVNLLSR